METIKTLELHKKLDKKGGEEEKEKSYTCTLKGKSLAFVINKKFMDLKKNVSATRSFQHLMPTLLTVSI